jgi:hypothetical protein
MPRFAHRTIFRAAILVGWLAAITSGLAMLAAHANNAGAPARAPQAWPLASTIARRRDVATILVFAHPNCPCTRATLGELDWLLAHTDRQTDVHVVLWEPDRSDSTWAEPDLAALAATIPTVQIDWDAGGREAARFGVATSGQVLLYDAADRLRFAGGITGARGHAGANDGRDGLLRQLGTPDTETAASPVFGCGLWTPPTT